MARKIFIPTSALEIMIAAFAITIALTDEQVKRMVELLLTGARHVRLERVDIGEYEDTTSST